MKKLICLLMTMAALILLPAVPAAAAEEPSFTYQLTTASGGQALSDLTALQAGDTVEVTLTVRRTDMEGAYQAYGLEFDLLATGLDFQSGGCDLPELSSPSKSTLTVLGGCRAVFAWADMVKKVCKTVPNPLTMTCTYTVTQPERARVWLDVALVYPEGGGANVPSGKGTVTLNVNGGALSGTDVAGTYAIGETITLPDAVRSGYTLKWYDGARYYSAGDRYEVNGSVTLTAAWSCAHTHTKTEYTALGNGFHTAVVKCTDCGETVGTAATEQCSYALKSDKDGHWNQCVHCGYETAQAGHSFVKGVCAVCGTVKGTSGTPGTGTGTPGSTGPVEPERTNPFTDVKTSAYYYDAVLWAVDQGITNGATATTFGPGITCTRGQIVTFLWRAAGSPAPGSRVNPFEDVKPGAYYYDAVLWAVEQGITNGTTATAFSPNATVNRGQTVTFLWRAAGSPAAAGSNPFADVKPGSYCYDAVLWAVEQGITNGSTATTFGPAASCTRGQIVTFLYRAAGK
ncbi:MAG: S-layer homology domain-containing protein [Oscillospiraceae bacterium]|nr:S-layer homology domain-containing protein [Oscillospiraceae bacterium]